MTDLRVASTYLEELAKVQEGTKAHFEASGGAVNGVGVNAWVTHGVACGPGNDAVIDLEAYRSEAIRLMRDVATRLAENLRAADKAYVATDGQASDNLGKQVRPD